MKNEITAVCSMVANNALLLVSGADIRDEINAWVTLIGRRCNKARLIISQLIYILSHIYNH